MAWLAVVPAVLVAIALVFVPGALIGWSLRLRAWQAVLYAPLLSMFCIGTSAVLTGFLHQRWSLIWVLALCLVSVVVGLIWARTLGRLRFGSWEFSPKEASPHGYGHRQVFKPGRWGRLGLLAAGIVLASLWFAPALARTFVSPDSISQMWDNGYHLNAIRYIVQTGNASPLQIGFMANAPIYPAGYHDLVALVVENSGASLTAGVHAVSFALILVLWPCACALLTDVFYRVRWWTCLVIAPLSLATMSFPFRTLDGGIAPNILALALAPGLLAGVIELLGINRRRSMHPLTALAVVVLCGVGEALTHPNSAIAVLGMVWPLLIITLWRALRSDDHSGLPRWLSRVILVALALSVLLIPVIWWKLAPGLELAPWVGYETVSQGIGEILFATATGLPPVWVGALLMLTGLVLVLRRGRSLGWTLWPFVVAGIIALAGAALPDSPMRTLIAGIFYNDSYRTAATIAIAFIPLILFGYQSLFSWTLDRLAALPTNSQKLGQRWSWLRRLAVRPMVLALVLALVMPALVSQSYAVRLRLDQVRNVFRYDDKSSYLSPDELDVINHIDDYVAPDEMIVVNPWLGGGLAYAFSGRPVSMYYIFDHIDQDTAYLNQHLNELASLPRVCQILQTKNAHWFLQSDPAVSMAGDLPTWDLPGLEYIPQTPGFEKVYQKGASALYRITAC